MQPQRFALPTSNPVPSTATPLQRHPENPRYFLFRDRPLALVTATEHYGSIINRPFDFERYLANAARMGMTTTRTFLLFRELQSERNPSSPCKPESPDYLAPYPRSGPGKALDGEPRFDLENWNPEYFARLHAFLQAASRHQITVELTLFSNSYGDGVWRMNPLRKENNLQGEGQGEWQEYTSLADSPRLARQAALVRKIIDECVQYDHVFFEICNEPGGGVSGHTSVSEVDAWQMEIARISRERLAELGANHLVVGSQAFTYTPQWSAAQGLDASFANPQLDSINVHPLPDVTLAGRVYQLGNFMSKELKLRELKEFCLATHLYKKPCVLDEDNTASIYRDAIGWTIHRKRAWMALICGSHYDYIDFSLTVGSESGTKASREGLRRPMGHLSAFIHAFDFIHAAPKPEIVRSLPASVVAGVLAVPAREYRIYLADEREHDCAGAGDEISGNITLDLPEGSYRICSYAPISGAYSPSIVLHAGRAPSTIELPCFRHDLALVLTAS